MKKKNGTSLICRRIQQFVMLKCRSKKGKLSNITVKGRDATNHKTIVNAFTKVLRNIGSSLYKTSLALKPF